MSPIPEDRYVIIIGAMKSGTTSLYSWLATHPGICPCRTKEPEFLSRHEAHGIRVGRYQDLWDFDPSKHEYVLEGSTGYTKYPLERGVPERIKEHGIRPRFLYILRDPFERIESHYNTGRFNPDWNRPILDDHLLNVSDYYLQLQQYEEFFPRDSILLLDFRHLREDPRLILREVCRFLGIEDHFPKEFERRNRTEYPNRWEHLYRKFIAGAGLNRMIPSGFRTAGRKMTEGAKQIQRRKLDPREREIVYNRLKKGMRALKEEYGFDTGVWGF